jgi:hypothetical protein
VNFDKLPEIIRNLENIKEDIIEHYNSLSSEVKVLGEAIDDFLQPILQRVKHVENWRMCR